MNSADSEPANAHRVLDIAHLAEDWSDDSPLTTKAAQTIASVGLHQFSDTPALVQSAPSNGAIKIDEKSESTIPIYPASALEGDYLGDLAYALTNNTAVPMPFARANIKTIVGAMVDRRVGFPGHEDLHMRHYSLQIAPSRCGKGESWERTGAAPKGVLNRLIGERAVLLDGGSFGSGEFMIAKLSKHDHQIVIARWDEMKAFFEKAATKCSTLESTFLTLYETTHASSGSFTNREHSFNDVRFSLSGDFTPEGFERTFAGQGGSSSGFLARCTLTYSPKKIQENDWSKLDPMVVLAAVKQIKDGLSRVDTKSAAGVWIPLEDSDAKHRRIEFANELKKSDDPECAELEAHFKRDLLLRVLFSGNDRITLNAVNLAIEWTEYQRALRKALWPEDAGGPVERMERKIEAALQKKGPLSDRDLMTACHTSRPGNGGSAVYHCAKKALLNTTVIREFKANRSGNPTYGLAD